MERFLYRLSRSAHADQFVLKGALMLRAWGSSEFRPTMDIDLLGKTSNLKADLVAQVKEVVQFDVEPDGLSFDPDSIRSEEITEDADYSGLRIRFYGTLDTARVNMQLDIGFGDIVHPAAEKSELPTILDHTPPLLLCYSRESAIAEKLEAMVKLGKVNSRMKDFYDIRLLSRQFDFAGDSLAEAIRLTFKNRETELSLRISAFEAKFVTEKQVQWNAFRNRLQQNDLPLAFEDVVQTIESFLTHPLAILLESAKPKNWIAPGPWA
ncbi:MAG: nucleotidyl transferase AbiEii/AbiGii toxin family protein [Rhodothermales bacterium]